MKPITDTQIAALADHLLRKKAMFQDAFKDSPGPADIRVDLGTFDLDVLLGMVTELQTQRDPEKLVFTRREGSLIIDAVITASQVIHKAVIGEENDDAEINLGRGRKVMAGHVDDELFKVVRLVKCKAGVE